jgi:hypothetical protein
VEFQSIVSESYWSQLSLRSASLMRPLLAISAIVLVGRCNDVLAEGLPPYDVGGFRDARFGMSEPEVRAMIAKDFGARPADITSAVNPIEATAVLTVKLASLDPGPGSAVVAYIFGSTSKNLIQVNVAWGDESGEKSDPNAMIAAATRLERYLAGYSWSKDRTRAGIPVELNTVVLFSSEDGQTGAVRLVLDGMKYQMEHAGKESTSPDPKGPPRLLINYVADRDNPDVTKTEKGKF